MADKDLTSIQEARELTRKARAAQVSFAKMEQEQVDQLVKAIAEESATMAEELAKMAEEETGFGKWQDKKKKNLLASEKLYAHIRAMKTIGVINEDPEKMITEVASPVGVIAALIPSTNPTSTTIYKAMIALKAGNGIVFSPHPSAQKCIGKTVASIQTVLKRMGVSEDLVSVMKVLTICGTRELMKKADLILATGGPAMVKAAYSSGTPALGVGAGNVPVYIERSADIQAAVRHILASKTFDNGTVCSSEQSIITEQIIAEKVKNTLVAQGGYFLEGDKAQKVIAIMERAGGGMNPAIVGKSATDLARMAGIEIPAGTRVLIHEEQGVGPQYPFSKEKLTALIGFYTVGDWQEASELCVSLLNNGGLGHSLAIHSQDEQIIRHFALTKPVSRVLVNTPSTHGAVGISTNLAPALTLGCGSVGGSSTSENVGPLQLFNIRRVAYGVDKESSPAGKVEGVDVELVTKLIVEQLKKMDFAS